MVPPTIIVTTTVTQTTRPYYAYGFTLEILVNLTGYSPWYWSSGLQVTVRDWQGNLKGEQQLYPTGTLNMYRAIFQSLEPYQWYSIQVTPVGFYASVFLDQPYKTVKLP